MECPSGRIENRRPKGKPNLTNINKIKLIDFG